MMNNNQFTHVCGFFSHKLLKKTLKVMAVIYVMYSPNVHNLTPEHPTSESNACHSQCNLLALR